jgi:hypothetical protein
MRIYSILSAAALMPNRRARCAVYRAAQLGLGVTEPRRHSQEHQLLLLQCLFGRVAKRCHQSLSPKSRLRADPIARNFDLAAMDNAMRNSIQRRGVPCSRGRAMAESLHYMVTLLDQSQAPITFWVNSSNELCAIRRAQHLMGEPAKIVDVALVAKPAVRSSGGTTLKAVA